MIWFTFEQIDDAAECVLLTALPSNYIADSPGSGADTLALATQEVLRLIALPSIRSVGTLRIRSGL
jgi:hypothetical protein